MSENDKKSLSTRAETKLPDAQQSPAGEIAAFLNAAKQANNGAKGRVVLALDATMSRQRTWDMACRIQGDMFLSVQKSTPLSMQLVYFRGYGECRASRWARSGDELAGLMSKIDCRAGHTQIQKVLKHTSEEHAKNPINALVYIGDAMEENADALGHAAGKLGLRNVPVFMFQEGAEKNTELVFKEIARLTRGGWFRFDRNAPNVLKDLLSSIAIYATGGIKALQIRGAKTDRLLIEQMGKGSK